MIARFVLILVAVAIQPALAQTNVPHTFKSGDVIEAQKFNENFDTLAEAIDDIPAGPQGPQGETGPQGSAGTSAPAGTLLMYAAATAPEGYLLANGQAVSRIAYADLFAVIGSTYGSGDGSTTFNLPNLTNRFPLGGGTLGTTGGATSATLTTNELPAHTHTGTTNADGAHAHSINDPGHSHSVSGTLQTAAGLNTVTDLDDSANEPDVTQTISTTSSSSTTGISVNSGGAHSHAFTTAPTGGGQAFSIMNPYVVVNYIIKY
jgi:microcystin-dependent protein